MVVLDLYKNDAPSVVALKVLEFLVEKVLAVHARIRVQYLQHVHLAMDSVKFAFDEERGQLNFILVQMWIEIHMNHHLLHIMSFFNRK